MTAETPRVRSPAAGEVDATSDGRHSDFEKSLHIAPMLHVSTPEFRHLFRILSKKCVLWTEMVVDETLFFTSNVEQHLGAACRCSRDTSDQVVCQIGGNTPEYAKQAARLAQEYGYVEVNLNVDCPSDRVSGKREFGAILLKRKETCIQVLQAMRQGTKEAVPISVKTRIGIDDHDDFDFLVDFIESLRPVCKRFYLHARKCILKGLTPALNRIVPPLNYPRVYALCRRFPDCDFWINGGIAGLKQAKLIANGCNDREEHAGAPCVQCNASNGSCVSPPSPQAPLNLRGCMLGRAAMDNPSLFWDVDRYFYGLECNPCQDRRQVLLQYIEYLERTYPRRCCDRDQRMTLKIPAPKVVHERDCCRICRTVRGNENMGVDNEMVEEPREAKFSSRVIDRSLKPVLGMFFGLPKAKLFRRVCDELSRDMLVRNCGPAFILRQAIKVMPDEILDRTFVKTEDLSDSDIVAHIAPKTGGTCC